MSYELCNRTAAGLRLARPRITFLEFTFVYDVCTLALTAFDGTWSLQLNLCGNAGVSNVAVKYS